MTVTIPRSVLVLVAALLLVGGAVGAVLALDGDESQEMPDLIGETWGEAQATLEYEGIEYRRLGLGTGRLPVSEQTPEAGEPITEGQVATVRVGH